MRHTLALLTGMLVFSNLVGAQELDSPESKAESFLDIYIDGKFEAAYEGLLEGGILYKKQPQQVALAITQSKGALELYGKPFAYEKICKREFSPSLVLLVYLLKTDNYPITWSFYFYRGRDDWETVGFLFVDQFQNLTQCS